MDNRPIGFLDSGVGGLTVVRELMRQLPHEEIVYIGDSARAPYGPRPAEQIREYTQQDGGHRAPAPNLQYRRFLHGEAGA